MRILGLDIGDKRIGVAITDKSETIAKPLKVINNDDRVIDELNNLIKDYNVKKMVVGIPYTLRGEIGLQAKKVTYFIDNVLRKSKLKIIYIDERFTSKISRKIIKKNKRTGEIDKISASIILSDYLNSSKKQEE